MEEKKGNETPSEEETAAESVAAEAASEVTVLSDSEDDAGESPASSEEVVRDPEEVIADLEAQVAKERDRYIRSVADMDNLRKRCRRDVDDALSRGRIQVIEESLPALDSIDLALRSVEATPENQAIYDGLVMVKRQFVSALEKFGLKVIDSKGRPFDPAMHEAIGHVPSEDCPSGSVMTELRSGYTLGERLVRASMVIVSSGPAPRIEATEADMTAESAAETAAEIAEETGE